MSELLREFMSKTEEMVIIDSSHLKGPSSLSDDYLEIIKYERASFLLPFMDLVIDEVTELPEEISAIEFCRNCGKKICKTWHSESNTMTVTAHGDTPEICEGDFTEFSFEISIPTGELIITDSIEGAIDLFNYEFNHDLNSLFGLKSTTLDYAKQQLLNVFVGNSDPKVFYDGNVISIGGTPSESKDMIAKVSTEIWWTLIVDKMILEDILYDNMDDHKVKQIMALNEVVTTKVKPGVYKCTYKVREDQDDYDYTFCTMKWDREIGR